MRRACILACVALLGGCKRHDMYTQDRSSTWDRSSFFADHAALRAVVPGAVPRREPDPQTAVPARITTALLSRGEQRYAIFCTPCHGDSGDGHGMIVARGFPMPQALSADRLLHAPAASLFETITRGHGTMYGYGDRIPSADRWAIIAYMRAVQQSQAASPALLPEADRATLAALK